VISVGCDPRISSCDFKRLSTKSTHGYIFYLRRFEILSGLLWRSVVLKKYIGRAEREILALVAYRNLFLRALRTWLSRQMRIAWIYRPY
jgi:hypothetical protein